MAEYDFHEGLSRVISQLTAAVTNTSLYSPTHPQVAQSLEKAHAALTEILRVKSKITLLLIGNDLVADSRRLAATASSSYVANFISLLKKHAIERITFAVGLPKKELRKFIQDLASLDTPSVRSTSFIKLGKVELRVIRPDERPSSAEDDAVPNTYLVSDPDDPSEGLQELLTLTVEGRDHLKELYLNAPRHNRIDIRRVDGTVKGFINVFRQEINPLSLLASVKSLDEYTFTHVTNVFILTVGLAENLGFKGEHLHKIGVASLLHDIGKTFIPEEILSKPGVLTTDERKTIETHTVKGARYLMGMEGIPKLAVLAALEHHQTFDGHGYPSMKGGWTPNIVSQLISVTDTFDAMRSRRSYQEPRPIAVIESVLMEGKGRSFNPIVVDRFLNMIRKGVS